MYVYMYMYMYMYTSDTPLYYDLPSIHHPHDSGLMQWARCVCGVKAPPLAARP